MEVVFGVKSSDIEEAYVWVECATGLVAEARENDAWGGNYYAFGAPHGERLRLINNTDPIDGEPVTEFPGWSVVLCVEGADTSSRALHGLENDPEHFQKLTSGH